MTLEQLRFELQKSSYMPILKINTTVLHDLWLSESAIVESWMLTVTLSPPSQLWRSGAPNSHPHSHCLRVNHICLLLWLPYSFKRHFLCSATWPGNHSFISSSALSLSLHIQSVSSEYSLEQNLLNCSLHFHSCSYIIAAFSHLVAFLLTVFAAP